MKLRTVPIPLPQPAPPTLEETVDRLTMEVAHLAHRLDGLERQLDQWEAGHG